MNLSRCLLRISTNVLLKLDDGYSKYCETARCDNFVMTHLKPFDTFAATEFNSKTSLLSAPEAASNPTEFFFFLPPPETGTCAVESYLVPRYYVSN
jgi:hypothetical protein